MKQWVWDVLLGETSLLKWRLWSPAAVSRDCGVLDCLDDVVFLCSVLTPTY